MTKNVAHVVVEDLGAVIGAFYQVEQASTGPKGKVKTEALKKEREAQVVKISFLSGQLKCQLWKMGNMYELSEFRMLQNMKTGGLRMMLAAAIVDTISYK